MPALSNLRRVRQERGLSVADVASGSGLSERHLRRLEAGEGDASHETREALSEALNAPEDLLWAKPGVGSHVRRLKRRGNAFDHAQIVARDEGLIILAPLAHGAPKAIDPLTLKDEYGVDLSPPEPDEVKGWKVLADRFRSHRRPASPGPSPEEVFSEAAKP